MTYDDDFVAIRAADRALQDLKRTIERLAPSLERDQQLRDISRGLVARVEVLERINNYFHFSPTLFRRQERKP